jgi:acyl-CoA synthetase (NDP forming)
VTAVLRVPPTGLDALFAPRGVAVLGASTAPAKLGAVMPRSLRGYRGRVFGVNARTPDPGQDVYASISDGVAASGAPPHLVVACVPAAATAAALREAAATGARAALVCADGFAEAGAQGQALQDELALLVKETGLRLLGPNTSGFLVPRADLTATFVPGAAEVRDGPSRSSRPVVGSTTRWRSPLPATGPACGSPSRSATAST